MSDEMEFDPMDEDFETMEADQSLAIVQDTMETFFQSASVDAVYGDPVQTGDTLIIPSAEVLAFAGFGLGSGYGNNSNEEAGNEGGGSGGGGGGRVFSRPVAVIIATPEGVRVEPVVDVTKIVLAALTAGGFMLGMLARMARPRNSIKDIASGNCCD